MDFVVFCFGQQIIQKKIYNQWDFGLQLVKRKVILLAKFSLL